MLENESEPDTFLLERLFPDSEELFSFEIPPLSSVKEKCDVVLDTNVLLLPYRTGSKNLIQIERVYVALKEKGCLFIPSQVAREFARNRANRLLELAKTLGDKTSEIKKPPVLAYPILDDLEQYKELTGIGNELDQKVEDYQKAVRNVQDAVRNWGWNDPVARMYRAIFSTELIKHYSQTHEYIEKELAYRQTNKVPPGYKDAAKGDRGVGDLLIWITILEVGKSRNKPLVFVTSDEKADWVYRSDNRGMLPRYELVDEFRRESSGNAFYIASFSEFLELFGAPQDVVSAVREEEKTINFTTHATTTTSAELNVSIQEHPLLELAAKDPRAAIRQGWLFLAEGISLAAKIGAANTAPDSANMQNALLRLQNSPNYPLQLVLELEELRITAIRAFNQSVYAYEPSSLEAKAFVNRCFQLRVSLN